MDCLLDTEEFICCCCKKSCKHTEGSWLPVMPLQYRYAGIVLYDNVCGDVEPRMPDVPVLVFDMREPVIITSDDFTCYWCQ